MVVQPAAVAAGDMLNVKGISGLQAVCTKYQNENLLKCQSTETPATGS